MYQSYKYKPTLEWNDAGSITSIPIEYINSIVVEYNYDIANMPIIKINAKVEKSLLNSLILNKHTTTMIFTLQKYVDKNGGVQFLDPYIKKDEFFYFLEHDLNYNESLDYSSQAGKRDTNDVYADIEIGLLNKNIINRNKKYINAIYRNTNGTDIILHSLSGMNVIIEPPLPSSYSSITIPPMNSITSLIKYLNGRSALYTTNYRLFFDFDRTYLTSSSGNAIATKDNAANINTVVVQIVEPNNKSKGIQGIEMDNVNKVYNLLVDAQYTQMTLDGYTDKSFNKLIGITTSGNILTSDIVIDQHSISNTGKTKIVRLTNENLGEMEQLKSQTQNSSIILNVLKNNVDSSIFTINKKYIIRNYPSYQYLDGDYLLHSKKEIFSRDNDSYINDNLFTFMKIKP